MQDTHKTNTQLLAELRELRQRNTELEAIVSNVKASEERFKAIANYSFDWQCWIGTDGRLLWSNPAVEKFTGYSVEEYLNLPDRLKQIICEEDRNRMLSHYENGVQKHQAESDVEFQLRRKDGSLKWVSVSYQPMYTDNGECLGMRSSIRDIGKRKMVEQALQESEEHFRAVSETSLDAIIIIDQDGNIVFWNKAAIEIFGYEANEAISNPIKMLMPEREMGNYNKAKGNFLKTGFSLFGKKPKEIIAKRKDGTEIFVETTMSHWKIQDKYYFGGTFRDITERKRAEKELIHTKDFLENIYNTTPDVLMVSNEKGYVISVNKAVEKMLGFKQEELIGKHTSELFPKDEKHAQIGLKMITELRKKGFIKYLEANWLRKDGSLCPVELNITMLQDKDENRVGGVAIIRDFTERKQQEDLLRASEERFRVIFEQAGIGIALLDRKGYPVRTNPAFEKMLGYSESELTTMAFTEFTHPDDAKKDFDLFKELMEGKREQYQIDKRYLCKHNRVIWSRLNVSLLRDAKGNPQYALGMAEDITQRKQSEEILQESESRYRELVDNSKNAIVIYEAIDDGRDFIFKEFNHAAENIEQLKKEALIGKFLTEAFPGVKKFGLLEVLQRVWKTGKPEDYPVAFYQDARISGWRDNYAYKLPSGEIVVIYENITERKQQEESLKASETRFRAIAESSLDAIITSDSNGKILYWNKAAETIYGYEAKEIVGKSIELLRPEGKRLIDRKNRENFIKTGHSLYIGKTVEGPARKKDGTGFLSETSTSYWKINDQLFFSGIVRDITKRKEAEETLRRSNAILQALNTGTTTLICVKDKKGKIIMANPAMLNFIGKSESEVIGKDDLDFIADAEQASRIRENDYHVMKSRRSQTVEETIDWPDRRWICLFNKSPFLDAHGNVIGVIGVGTDVTERKRAEKALQQEKYFSDTVINSLPGIFYLLDEQGHRVRWNKNLEKVTGCTAKELQNLDALALIHEDDRALTDSKKNEVFTKGHAEGEARLLGKHGKISYYFFTGRRLKIEEKSYLAGVGIDITKLKRLEQELKKAHDELEKRVKQRTAALKEANDKLQISQEYLKKFAGMLLSAREEERKNIALTIHDELGSMAIAVDSQISIAKEECNENNKQATFKALTNAQAALRKAVVDLRKLAVDLRPPNLEIMGLNAALTDFIDREKEQTRLKIVFRNELGNKKISADMAIVIYRVIQEALTNIMKHAKAKTARISLYAEKRNINLEISDDGAGCDLQKALYRKGKPKIGIEGMRERVESLGGEFIITSAPNRGTQLKAMLPKY